MSSSTPLSTFAPGFSVFWKSYGRITHCSSNYLAVGIVLVQHADISTDHSLEGLEEFLCPTPRFIVQDDDGFDDGFDSSAGFVTPPTEPIHSPISFATAIQECRKE